MIMIMIWAEGYVACGILPGAMMVPSRADSQDE
jgi:hypothetical protein